VDELLKANWFICGNFNMVEITEDKEGLQVSINALARVRHHIAQVLDLAYTMAATIGRKAHLSYGILFPTLAKVIKES